ncbi:MAG: FeoB-associated Cys-rich membrane protein [Erysipelotrichaceae bacterium]|uniref:FeoB-associated Cys-rich membrane protein n=1 Tax=Copranaerobaculum intestinale TaxID=2692629 RepID=A0A6N8U800_9FIRM|nr:FeoB-associated Cys-rich membrane protein [Copranaerobaculum intestinale]MBS6374131.1 FeoB-associated Cys-rich membrane protein [Erysipelotrichaceae bacterium]MXQ74112.1 FeoB-associated Cys-rich membrane protein [Copranaerobaculum intestinale]
MSDFIIGGIVSIIVFTIVVKLLQRHKKGRSSCGCGCCDCQDHET